MTDLMSKSPLLESPSKRRQTEFLLAVARSRVLHGAWVAPPRTPAAFERYLLRLAQPGYKGYWVLTSREQLKSILSAFR